jgi:hypothetical protein
MSGYTTVLPARSAGRGTAGGGGGVLFHCWQGNPSTTLRVVPLPIGDGEDIR